MTITEIARAAGVSKSTISRYLNGRHDMMGEKTLERIRQIINLSGYRPSTIAQSLKSKKTMQVGVVIADIASPFSASMIKGIGGILERYNYMPIIVGSSNDIKNEEKYIGELIRRGVDGFLVNSAAFINPYLIQVASQGFPLVLCDRYIKDYNLDIVTSEKRPPTLQLIKHIKEQGFEIPVLFIEPFEENSTRYLRRKAFMDGLQEIYGVYKPEEHVVLIDVQEPDKTREQIKGVISGAGEKRPPMIMTANTVSTMHVLSVLKSLRLSIPDDIGICGVDDWTWGKQIDWASLVDPGISTYSVDAVKLGASAARLLIDRMHNPDGEKKKITIPVSVNFRGSTVRKKT